MRWTALNVRDASQDSPGVRSSHTLSIVDGTLYLWGGEQSARTPINSDLFRTDTDTAATSSAWQKVQVTGAVPSPRLGHAAAVVGSTIYIFGGRAGMDLGETASNDLHAFDTIHSTWRTITGTGDIPAHRSFHTMTSLGSKLYVFGGCGKQGRLNDLHEFDTHTGIWKQLPSPAEDVCCGRGGSTLTPAADGRRLYVVGGFCGHELGDSHAYDIASQSWAALPGTLPPRSVFAVHLLNSSSATHDSDTLKPGGAADTENLTHAVGSSGAGDRLLAVFGEIDPSDKGHAGAGQFSAELFVYEVGSKAGDWSAVLAEAPAGGEAPCARGWFAACSDGGQELYVHGGLDVSNERLSDLHVLSC